MSDSNEKGNRRSKHMRTCNNTRQPENKGTKKRNKNNNGSFVHAMI